MAKIRLAAPLQTDSIVDGAGLRAVLWTQGCTHNCKGCHNPETHDLKGGYLEDVDNIKKEIKNLEYHDGITLSGGDPFMQIGPCLEIAKYAHKCNLNVWCYIGFTFEQLLELSKTNDKIMLFLKEIDILIDGKFVLEEKSFDVIFRGSKNQRIIDVQKSLETLQVVIPEKYKENELVTN